MVVRTQAKQAEDPHHCGLVLEWVYGSIVSTAEKARDGARRPLGNIVTPPEEGHYALLRALEEQQAWESKLQQVCVCVCLSACVYVCVCRCVCVSQVCVCVCVCVCV